MSIPGAKLETYTDTPYFLTNPSRDDMRQADRSCTLDDITTYIYQSLVDYQGKWEQSDRSNWIITMPNARYLEIGNSIGNDTTGEVYRISSIINRRKKLIKLTAGTTYPIPGNILRLKNDNIVNFVSGYPKEYKDKPDTIWVDTITYKVIRREPGTIGRHPFDPPTEIKPRIRECRVDPDHRDCHVIIMGQWFDNLIQFDCWSKTNNRVDELIEWFEDFMYKYTWVFKKNGVNEILYWMRKQDEEISKWRADLANRSTIYYFRTETITTLREYDLKQIDLYLEVANSLPSGYYGVGYTKIPPSGYMEVLDDGFSVTV